MNEVTTKENIGNIHVTVHHKERTWYHKLFGLNKGKGITGLIIDDFEIINTTIHCVVDNGNGYYEFHIASDIKIKLKES